jgi:hypothetical protein
MSLRKVGKFCLQRLQDRPLLFAYLTALFTVPSEIMFDKVALSTFISGLRAQDAGPPPFLKFRSSNTFIIATVVIAVFTVGIPFML